jgi:hypothetical protein
MADIYKNPGSLFQTHQIPDDMYQQDLDIIREHYRNKVKDIREQDEQAEEFKSRFGINLTIDQIRGLNNFFTDDAGNVDEDGLYDELNARTITENLRRQSIIIDLDTIRNNLPAFVDAVTENTSGMARSPMDNLGAIMNAFAGSWYSTERAFLGNELADAQILRDTQKAESIKKRRAIIDQQIAQTADYQKRNPLIEALKMVTQTSVYSSAVVAGGLIGGGVGSFAVGTALARGQIYNSLEAIGVDPQLNFALSTGGGALIGIIQNKLGSAASFIAKRTGAQTAQQALAKKVTGLLADRLHLSGTWINLAAGPVGKILTEGIGEFGEEALEKLTENGAIELAKIIQKEGIEVTPEYQGILTGVMEEGIAGGVVGMILAPLGLGIDAIIRVAETSKGKITPEEALKIKALAETTKDTEELKKKVREAGITSVSDESLEEIKTVAEQTKERAIAKAEEEYRQNRLYSGEDQSGEVYRDQTGNFYTENIRHTESNGVTTGTYQGGDPAKTEANTYWKITYEMEGEQAVIDHVRIAERYESLKPEILQGFANDLNQEVAWEGTLYTPQEGVSRAIHIGWEEIPKRNEKAATGPSRANIGRIEPFTGAERQFFDRLKNAIPQQTDLEARAVLEQFKMGADLQNLSFEEYLNNNFQEGVFSETDANTLTAAQQARGKVKGGIQFDPESGKALISGSTWADFSTASHEFSHALRRQLSGDYLVEAERVFGVQDGTWTEENEEAFSRAYEKYLETGEAPTSKLAELFKKFKEFMGRIYQLVKNEHILTEDQKALFDRIFRDAEANREGQRDTGSEGTVENTPSTTRYDAELNRRIDGLNRDGRAQAEEVARERGTSGEAVEEVLFQPDTRAEEDIINDPNATYTEKAQAVVDKAWKVYTVARLEPADQQHGPTAALIADAMNIADEADRERVIGEIRMLRDQYAGTDAEYKAPNGKPSLLLDALGEEAGRREWYAVRSPSFKEWFGDWEKIADLTINSSDATLSNTIEVLRHLSGKELVNLETGITARIGSTQRSKIISTAALNKTLKNGFTAQQHNAAAAHIDKLWKYAEQTEEHPDKGNDANIKSIKRFATPVIFGEETGIAYITVKESIEHGHRIYSIELQEIKKPRLKGSTLEKRTTAEVSKLSIAQKLEEVKRNISQVRDENGEPLAVFKAMYPYDYTQETEGNKGPRLDIIDRPVLFPTFDSKEPKGVKISGFFGDRETAGDFLTATKRMGWELYSVFLNFRNSGVIDAENQKAGDIQFGSSGKPFRDLIRSGLYDSVIIKNTSDENTLYVALNPTQIKSATDNAGTFSNENPSMLFQDEVAMAAFLRNDPGVLDLAATFDSWEEFMGYYEIFDERQPADIRETAAREGFYKTIWEDAQRLKNQDTASEEADTGQKTVEDFMDLVNSEAGLREIVELTRAIEEEAGHFQPNNTEEEQQHNAEMRALKNAFDHQNWKNARIQLSKNKPISPTTAKILRGQVRNNPEPYMDAWAVLSGDDSWLSTETWSRLDSGEDFDTETDRSPEELRRIKQALDHDEIVQKIEDNTLQAGDPQLENYEEELSRRQKENREKIERTKEKLSDYAWMIERAELNIQAQERIAAQLAADTTPEGITAQGKQRRKIKAYENQLLTLRKEYASFLQSIKKADKGNFKDFSTLIRILAKTERSLEAIQDLRAIRKKEVRALMRKPDLKTVRIYEAREIQWIQSHFDNLYEVVPKFIGKKAKNLQQLFSDFTTKEEYRDELRRKLSSVSYGRIEHAIYKNTATREVRSYSDLTKAQRHTLYRYLLENEKLFKDVGLDEMEVPRQFTNSESERIRQNLDNQLPPDIIYKLESRLPLDQWKMSDMETLAGIMGDIRKEGREHRRAWIDARNKIISDYQKRFTEMTGKLLRPQDIARLPGAETDEIEKKRAAPWNLAFSGINLRRMIRMMIDGGKDELGYDVVTAGEDRAFNEQTRYERQRRDRVNERLKTAKINLKELWSNTFTIEEAKEDGIAKTTRFLDEMLFYRRAKLNDRAYAAVVFGNFATTTERRSMEIANNEGRFVDALEIQNKIVKRYDDAMQQLEEFQAKPENEKFGMVETIIGEDYDENYDRLKEFAAREYNYDMGSEAFYIPLSRLDATGDLTEQETIKQVFFDTNVVQGIDKGFTMSRVDIAPWHQKPVKPGLYKTWDQMVTKQEHLMAYTGYLREMEQIFQGRGSEVLMSNIQRRFTLAGKNYITHYISELSNPNPQRDYTNLDTINRLTRGHYPAAVLSFRLSSIIKQAITSPPPFFQFGSVGEYTAASMRCLSEDTRNMIREKSNYMASRVIDPANEFIKQIEMSTIMGKGGKLEANLAKIENFGMKGLEWIDSVCVMPGWLAAYEQKRADLNRQEGINDNTIEAEAVRYADQVVRDTQPSSRQVDLPPIFKHQKNPFMQMFLQFQVPQAVIAQNLFVDAPNNFKQGRYMAAVTAFAIYGLTAALVGLLEEDEDDEKLNPKYRGIDAVMGYMESIPIVGSYTSYTVEHLLRTKKLQLSQFKPFPVMDEGFRAGAAVTQEKWDQAFIHLLRALGYYSGLPVGLGGEIEKAVTKNDPGILFGYK